jgi:ribonuclease HI
MTHEQKAITIFTDGASKGNPGPGGWAAVIFLPTEDKVVELGGHEDRTTNNRMELQGAINALLHIRHLPDDVTIHTDSSYLIQGITKWVKGWIKNGWTTQGREDVQNRDLWEILAAVMEEREEQDSTTEWKHVAGHSGIPGNERVDEIASTFAEKKNVELYIGPAADYGIDLTSTVANRTKKTVKDTKKSRSSKPAYSYLSMIDGNIKTYKTWAECESNVKGVKGAKFKKALSKEEEELIRKEWSS